MNVFETAVVAAVVIVVVVVVVFVVDDVMNGWSSTAPLTTLRTERPAKRLVKFSDGLS
jgi:hypothetical protein